MPKNFATNSSTIQKTAQLAIMLNTRPTTLLGVTGDAAFLFELDYNILTRPFDEVGQKKLKLLELLKKKGIKYEPAKS